jgi:hypothetical protein
VVPNQCAAPGGAWVGNETPFAELSLNPYGDSHGAKMASTANSSTMNAPEASMPICTPPAWRSVRQARARVPGFLSPDAGPGSGPPALTSVTMVALTGTSPSGRSMR